MSAADLLVWGIVLHLIADWPLQNDWMARNKAARRERRATGRGGTALRLRSRWWDRHPAAYVHSGVQGVLMLLVFPWWGALAIAAAHFVIDLRTPVVWWSKFIRQTQPSGASLAALVNVLDPHGHNGTLRRWAERQGHLVDVGLEVRFWTDQVFHLATIALVALIAGGAS